MERTFRLNCTAATFPLISTYFGRSAMTRSPEDSNYIITNAYSGAQADRDIGIPMPIYMQNVMPTTQGLSSVGYKQLAAPFSQTALDFDQAFVLRTWDDSRYIFTPANGANYIYDHLSKQWLQTGTQGLKKGMVTKAYLHKHTYVCYQREGVFRFDSAAGGLVPVALAGIDQGFIEGITHANNYLVAFTHDTIYWCGEPNQEDFIPSLSTTAGSEMPNPIRGTIVCCLPISEGFIIYTTANAVLAKYSGNVRFPFQFVEIAGSAGIQQPEHVTGDANNDVHYAWTSNGMMAIAKGDTKAAGVFPEITDFLTGHLLEDYIGPTGKMASSNISKQWSSESQTWGNYPLGANNLQLFNHETPLKVKLTLVANRWLAISYGLGEQLTWVVVYDILLKRWGKLRVPHVDCFEFSTTRQTVIENEANHTFAFLQVDGTVVAVDFEDRATANDSVLIFGRLQHTRGKVLTLHSMEIENGRPSDMVLSILTSLDGKNWLPDKLPLPQIQTKNLTKWLVRTTGINHCFKLTGSFDVVTIQGSCTVGGGR